MFMRRTTASV